MVKCMLLQITYWDIVAVLMLFTIVEGAVLDKICSVSRCKHGGPDIHFPFWLNLDSSNHPADDCAYPPGFQLSCGGSPGRGEADHLYNKDDTILELQYLVTTSIKALQLSLFYKAIVSFIDYKNLDIYLVERPYLTDIVPTPVTSNSSATPNRFHFNSTKNYFTPYGYTFFNCSSLSPPTTMSSYHVNSVVSSQRTTDFKDVYVYSSDSKTILMLPKIKSCTKMYNISIKLPNDLQILSWSLAAGDGRCEPVHKNCKFDDHARTNNNTHYCVTPRLLGTTLIFPLAGFLIYGYELY